MHLKENNANNLELNTTILFALIDQLSSSNNQRAMTPSFYFSLTPFGIRDGFNYLRSFEDQIDHFETLNFIRENE